MALNAKRVWAATKESIDNEYKVRSLLHFEEFHLEDRRFEKKRSSWSYREVSGMIIGVKASSSAEGDSKSAVERAKGDLKHVKWYLKGNEIEIIDNFHVAMVQHRFNKGSAVERKQGNSFQFRLKDN